MITDKEALQAARALRNYCSERWCDKCAFGKERIVCDLSERNPSHWKLNMEELPAAAKEHLMRRFMTVE